MLTDYITSETNGLAFSDMSEKEMQVYKAFKDSPSMLHRQWWKANLSV